MTRRSGTFKRAAVYATVAFVGGAALMRTLLKKRDATAVNGRRARHDLLPPAPSELAPTTAPPPKKRNVWGIIALSAVALIVVGWIFWIVTPEYPLEPQLRIPDADVTRGRTALVMYGCGACHVIPGIRGANGRVGPQLRGLREQIYIAGRLPNLPENLVGWIVNPQHYDPHNAMPNLGVSEADARDMAAYLYSVR